MTDFFFYMKPLVFGNFVWLLRFISFTKLELKILLELLKQTNIVAII